MRRPVGVLLMALFLLSALCLLAAPARAVRTRAAAADDGEPAKLAPAERQLARDVFQQLIETNTTHSTGSTTAAAEAIRARLLKAGFAAEDMEIAGPRPNRMNLVVRYRALGRGTDAKPVLVIGHLDVVEAARADWSMDPFTFTEKDGYFYGRGTQDMKDSDAAFVTSFILLKEAGYVPKRDIILALTADEEGGADNGVDWLMKNRPELVHAAFAVNPDAGGMLLHDGKAVEMDLEATEKVYADYELTATNPGGHSSRPVPENTIYEVADALGRLERSPFPAELNAVTREYLEAEARHESPEKKQLISKILGPRMDQAAVDKLSQDPGYNATLHTTCVATMMEAGLAVNALPAEASANVNCRIMPGHSPEEIRLRLAEIVDDVRVKVQWKDEGGALFDHAPGRAPMAPPPPLPEVMKPLRAVVQSMWPGLAIVPEMESGASDSIYTMAAGVPSYGFSGMGIDENDDRAHGRDERLRVEAYYTGVEFTRRIVRALGDE